MGKKIHSFDGLSSVLQESDTHEHRKNTSRKNLDKFVGNKNHNKDKYVGEIQIQKFDGIDADYLVYPSLDGSVVEGSTSKSFDRLLAKSKKEILELIASDKQQSPRQRMEEKKESSKQLLETLGKEKEEILEILQLLDKGFDKLTKKSYTEAYSTLPDFDKKPLKNGYMKALVSNVKKGGLEVCLGKKGGKPWKVIIPEKNLIGNDFLRGDEIVISYVKQGDNAEINHADKRWLDLQDKNLLGKNLVYASAKSKVPLQGKIIGLGQDKAGKEVIFKPEKGSQFSLKLDTLLSGLVVQKPLHKEKKAEKKIIPLSKQEKEIQPQAQRKIVYDGSKDKPRMRRDGKNVLD